MSWNAHTDHIFAQCQGTVEYLCLCGPDGGTWGSSGSLAIPSTQKEVANCAAKPMSGFFVGGAKYMFLKEIDGIYCFNKSGKGLAMVKGSQYNAYAISAEGCKTENCVTALTSLKNYLSGIGYN